MSGGRRLLTTGPAVSPGVCLVLPWHIPLLVLPSIPCYRQSNVVTVFHESFSIYHATTQDICGQILRMSNWNNPVSDFIRLHQSLFLDWRICSVLHPAHSQHPCSNRVCVVKHKHRRSVVTANALFLLSFYHRCKKTFFYVFYSCHVFFAFLNVFFKFSFERIFIYGENGLFVDVLYSFASVYIARVNRGFVCVRAVLLMIWKPMLAR